jgi:hypothetical protein
MNLHNININIFDNFPYSLDTYTNINVNGYGDGRNIGIGNGNGYGYGYSNVNKWYVNGLGNGTTGILYIYKYF